MRTMITLLLLGTALSLRAQYKAPSQYLPKNFPPPAPRPGAPQPRQPAAAAKPPAPPVQPKFRNVATNAQFFFTSDTNRAYPWVKISANAATNVKSGIRQTLNPELPVQR